MIITGVKSMQASKHNLLNLLVRAMVRAAITILPTLLVAHASRSSRYKDSATVIRNTAAALVPWMTGSISLILSKVKRPFQTAVIDTSLRTSEAFQFL